MGREMGFDEVVIAEAPLRDWREMMEKLNESLGFIGISISDVGKQVRINDDGTLTIFVKDHPGEIALEVPADKWSRRQ